LITMKCFHHNDPDGYCAAFWVLMCLKHRGEELTAENFVEMNYDRQFPMDTIKKDEEIWIVDFSISRDEMLKLLSITRNVTWIDHHITAIEKMVGVDEPIAGIRLDGVSGCMLTWAYTHGYVDGGQLGYLTDEIDPEDGDRLFQIDPSVINRAPMFTQLINDWDIWARKMDPQTVNFMTCLQSAENIKPTAAFWNHLWWDDKHNRGQILEDMVSNGEYMLKYRDGYAKTVLDSIGFAGKFEGYNCFFVNLPKCNSEFFKSVEGKGYDIFIPFYYTGSNWLVSLYSQSVDVSKIAVKHGGGGHRGAAGFTVYADTVPFKKIA